MTKIFLSASIPLPERDRIYYNTADIMAIRDAIRAMATVVIPKAHLVWGGHPSITPLIRFVMDRMNANVNEHVTLYQSKYFEGKYPLENDSFENVIFTPKKGGQKGSLEIMRNTLNIENSFEIGIFIGGMEGVIDEYKRFRKYHPRALVLPIASTGAASKIIYDTMGSEFDIRLLTDYAYMALFRDLLKNYLS